MLGKRSSKSMQKDQQMCHHQKHLPNLQNQKKSSFFNLPGLFVGLNPKVLPDLDSASSPTSPLDFKVHPGVAANPLRSPRSPHPHPHPHHGHFKVWDCDKVGLSIVDSLDHGPESPRKLIGSLESKNILFGPQLRIKSSNLGSVDSLDGKKTLFGPPQVRIRSPRFADPCAQIQSPDAHNSLPKNYVFPHHAHFKSPLHKGSSSSSVVFEIGNSPTAPYPFKGRSSPLDACTSVTSPQLKPDDHLMPMSIGSSNGFVGSISASDIELSEDYTRVMVHGPNPKTTHIFADFVLERPYDDSSSFRVVDDEKLETSSALYPSRDFLSLCDMCKKVLEGGEDIYIYRGELAFCSLECRASAILIDEEMEKTHENHHPLGSGGDVHEGCEVDILGA